MIIDQTVTEIPSVNYSRNTDDQAKKKDIFDCIINED